MTMKNSRTGGQLKQLFPLEHEHHSRGLPSEIHPIDQFHALIEHERRRSDRTGDSFALMIFSHDEVDTDLSRFNQLPDLLASLLRSTDDVGWFDKNRIGVLLLDTTAEGADKFQKKLCDRVTDYSLPHSQIYAYPSQDSEHSGDKLAKVIPLKKKLKPNFNTKSRQGRLQTFSKKLVSTIIHAEKEKTDGISGLEPLLGVSVPAWKRVFDILFASIALLLLFPLLTLVAAFIKIISPGPFLFKQMRVGYLGEQFMLLKFRTMKVGVESSKHEEHVRSLMKSNIPMNKLDQNKKIIPLGKFMRSTGIDELPQLINVLRGDMSLVGPRPCTISESLEYLHWQKRRFHTLPGLTGLWQVNGKHKLTFKQMIRYDIAYEQQRSFWLDLKIITRTFPTIYRMATDG